MVDNRSTDRALPEMPNASLSSPEDSTDDKRHPVSPTLTGSPPHIASTFIAGKSPYRRLSGTALSPGRGRLGRGSFGMGGESPEAPKKKQRLALLLARRKALMRKPHVMLNLAISSLRRSPKHNECRALLTKNARDIKSPRRLPHAASSLPPPPPWEGYPICPPLKVKISSTPVHQREITIPSINMLTGDWVFPDGTAMPCSFAWSTGTGDGRQTAEEQQTMNKEIDMVLSKMTSMTAHGAAAAPADVGGGGAREPAGGGGVLGESDDLVAAETASTEGRETIDTNTNSNGGLPDT
ncbi:unnamed protein product [Vitrella brassicaformis CCMP3155]|uniref:Uncharacterized protein n=1 Tax=Vitrella brassicaformis (strain CCMP3155) TaxID=1169540 RepID=A0A0G4GIG8_VITBC|nr:unnamed protein product [Vitrella brassicaformis CCMP3155]|eukprot:CEM29645.1 unnamed protein product [Vitrella brassicaformis CCMP3155]